MGALREAIQSSFYDGLAQSHEVFVSDGSKCDISRLQVCIPAVRAAAWQKGLPNRWCVVISNPSMWAIPDLCPGDAQVMFGPNATVSVQDPSYPAYVDTSVMIGQTGDYNGVGFDNIQYMMCSADNGFFPDLAKVLPRRCPLIAMMRI